MWYPSIALHFGHRIPMYKRMFPTRNNEIAPYNNVLNGAAGMYFSANARTVITEKPTATNINYRVFRRLMTSLGLIRSLSPLIERSASAAGARAGYFQAVPLKKV